MCACVCVCQQEKVGGVNAVKTVETAVIIITTITKTTIAKKQFLIKVKLRQ